MKGGELFMYPTYMTPDESLMNELNIMVNSNAFSSREKAKLADIFRTCQNDSHILDFFGKVKNIYLSRMNQ